MKASGMDVLRTDAYPRCFYSRRVYNEVGILQVKLRMLSTSVRSVYKELHADRETGC